MWMLRTALAACLLTAFACHDEAPPTAPSPGASPPAAYRLVWADEFDSDGPPDPAKWRYDVGGNGWGNSELQFYTDGRRENARVERGLLIIEARREDVAGPRLHVGPPDHEGEGDWTYGRIEVRAQLPRGRGSWPAIWMLPLDGTYAKCGWPDDGEIDIMEHVGFDPGVVHASVHTRRLQPCRSARSDGRGSPCPDASEPSTSMRSSGPPTASSTSVDGRVYFSFAREPQGGRGVPGPSTRRRHLLLNVAVGGNWGGQKGVDDAHRFLIASRSITSASIRERPDTRALDRRQESGGMTTNIRRQLVNNESQMSFEQLLARHLRAARLRWRRHKGGPLNLWRRE